MSKAKIIIASLVCVFLCACGRKVEVNKEEVRDYVSYEYETPAPINPYEGIEVNDLKGIIATVIRDDLSDENKFTVRRDFDGFLSSCKSWDSEYGGVDIYRISAISYTGELYILNFDFNTDELLDITYQTSGIFDRKTQYEDIRIDKETYIYSVYKFSKSTYNDIDISLTQEYFEPLPYYKSYSLYADVSNNGILEYWEMPINDGFRYGTTYHLNDIEHNGTTVTDEDINNRFIYQLDDLVVDIDSVVYSLPQSMEILKFDNFVFIEDITIEPFSTKKVIAECPNLCTNVYLIVGNPTAEEVNILDAYLYGVYDKKVSVEYYLDVPLIRFSNNITYGSSTMEDILNAYGTPNDIETEDNLTIYTYSIHNGWLNIKLSFMEDGTLCIVSYEPKNEG